MRSSNRDRSTVLLFCSGLLLQATLAWGGAADYRDLRRVEPIRGDAAAGQTKATVCGSCHGTNGASVAPLFPRISGQRPEYLYNRLVSFKRASPKDPYYAKSPMVALVATLSEQDMKDLALFFAQQTPTGPEGDTTSTAAEKGRRIFLNGEPTHGTPACQGCHGHDAGGVISPARQYAVYPALRGQYAPYVISRLTSFKSQLPAETTSDFIMGGVAQTLDSEAIESLAAWLSALAPAKSPGPLASK